MRYYIIMYTILTVDKLTLSNRLPAFGVVAVVFVASAAGTEENSSSTTIERRKSAAAIDVQCRGSEPPFMLIVVADITILRYNNTNIVLQSTRVGGARLIFGVRQTILAIAYKILHNASRDTIT